MLRSNKNGRGTGGVGGIYQVSNSSSTSCIAASMEPTGSWPVGIATNTFPAAIIPTASTTVDSFPSGGPIAGIVVGAVVAVILVALLLLFLLRRRRRRGLHAGAAERKRSGQLDLADGEYTEYENPGLAPKIEPYREVETFRPPEGRGQEAEASGTSRSDRARARHLKLGWVCHVGRVPRPGILGDPQAYSRGRRYAHERGGESRRTGRGGSSACQVAEKLQRREAEHHLPAAAEQLGILFTRCAQMASRAGPGVGE
jgi:hypothetical protein